MRKISLALLLAFAGCTVFATSIKTYSSRVVVADDGAATVAVKLQLSDVESGRLLLPLAFNSLENFQGDDAIRGVTLQPRIAIERAHIEIYFAAPVPEGVTLNFSFSVKDALGQPKAAAGEKSKLAADTMLLRHSFVNTQPETIGVYSVEVLLPEGKRVQRISEQLPKPKRSEVAPRVRLDLFDEHHQGAKLQLSNVKQGDRTSMVLDVVESTRSLVWLLVGLLIAVAYLFGFKDLVRSTQISPQ